jgi:hypothetical protein
VDLDELLSASAPSLAPRTPQLERELNDLVTAAEAAQSQRRWPIRVALVSGAVAGAVALGAVASATGVLPGWPSFSTTSGQTCKIILSASALEPGEGEPVAASFSTAERRRTLTAAQSFLADFDYESVDRRRAIARWQAVESDVRAAQSDPAERQPRLTGDDLEVTAVSRSVLADLDTYLAGRGLDIRAIMVATSTSGCVL